jgi:ubiquitin carboxyl-terminal hydrolase 25
VKFDRKSGQAFKSQAYIKFEETITMDRFMENVDPVKKENSQNLQSDIRRCREHVQMLEVGEAST